MASSSSSSQAVEVSIPCTEQRSDGKKSYTVYKLIVKSMDGEQVLYRRYSEFYDVYKALKDANIGDLPAYFPSKQMFGNQKASTIEKRRISLQVFINQVLANPVILRSSPELVRLLDLSTAAVGGAGSSSGGGSGTRKKVARALFPFQGIDDTDISFKEGDLIIIHDDSDTDGWWIGEFGGKCGTFPNNYVKLIDSARTSDTLTTESEAARASRENVLAKVTNGAPASVDDDGYPRVKALFAYRGNPETDLDFDAGAVIVVTEIDEESGWWFGKCGEKLGLFPSNFVVMLNDGGAPS